MQNQNALLITAVSAKVEQQMPDYWRAIITWRFTNTRAVQAFVLLAAPRPILEEDHWVLDHSAPDRVDDVYFNQPSTFHIVAIAAGQTFENSIPANLPADDSTERLSVTGRFGYSDVAPNPEWEETGNWLQAGKWQKKVDSVEFSIERR